MIKVDIGKECSDEYCKKAVESISSILNRDYNVWGLPCIVDLNLLSSCDVYWKDILDSKTRNMVRKGTKNQLNCYSINKNKFLTEVYNINTSTLFRQGRIMGEGYRKFPKYTEYTKNCTKHFWEFMGAFTEDNKLIAYISILSYKELILISQILGHADYLKTGVMNLILCQTIYHIVTSYTFAKYIQYGFWNSGGEGLRHFKKSMGFNPMDIREA